MSDKIINIDTLKYYNNKISNYVEVKQDKLVSGTNIKTINGESILGDGNIIISGGSLSGGSSAYTEVNHGTSDTAFTLTPNTFHIWDEVNSLTLILGDETEGVANEYIFQFTSGSEPTTLSLPGNIKWTNGETPTIKSGKIYQISILKGLGTILEWDADVDLFFYINGIQYQVENGMTWITWVSTPYNTNGYYIDYHVSLIMRSPDDYYAYAIADAGIGEVIEVGRDYTETIY